MNTNQSDESPESKVSIFLFKHTYVFDLLFGIIMAVFIWKDPVFGAIIILLVAALLFLSVRYLRFISRSKANKLFLVLNEHFPRTSTVISDLYHKHFHFFIMTTLSQTFSKIASGLALLCFLSGGISIFRWLQLGDALYLYPLLATGVLYLFASRASLQSNYPLYWLINMGQRVPARQFLWRKHVALATLVLVVNCVCNLVGSEDGKRKIVADQITKVVSEDDLLVMWSSSSRLLSGYNQISAQIAGLDDLFSSLQLDEELDVLVGDAENAS